MPKTKRAKKVHSVTERADRNAVLEIPTEIWLEIVSGSNFLILDSEKDGIPRSLLLLGRSKISSCPKTIPPAYRERPETLRALSQTCRAFRAVFLPVLWERVEACFIPKDDTAWYARLAKVLLDRCTGLMKRENQNLARHVRIFSVSLSWHRIEAILPVFAQCLESLPNLDTLHILYLKSKYEKMVTETFDDVELPTVRTVILPSYAHAILAACCNVRDVSCNEEIGTKLFKTLVECCPKVERIQGFQLTSAKLKKLSESLPMLRELPVPIHMDISSLSVFKRLAEGRKEVYYTDAVPQLELPYIEHTHYLRGAESLAVIELLAENTIEFSDSETEDGFPSPTDAKMAKIEQSKREKTGAARALLKPTAGKAPKRIKVSYWEDIEGMVGMMDITYGKYWVRSEEFDV